MPTKADPEPKSPAELPRTPSQAVAFGRMQWRRKWRTFSVQWSQPQLMKLAKFLFGEACLHSSQIYGFNEGMLRDPAPKVLTVVGHLNLAIAAANGIHHPTFKTAYTLPGKLSELWRGKHHMVTAEGVPMGPVEVFMAITGDLDLCNDGDLDINDENIEEVCKSLGKYLRFNLMERGIDFVDPEELNQLPPVAQLLVTGKVVTPQDINTSEMAEVCGVTEDELIEHAVSPAL